MSDLRSAACAIEFLLGKLRETKSNRGFFDSMNT
jgi:transcription termination factor Rho